MDLRRTGRAVAVLVALLGVLALGGPAQAATVQREATANARRADQCQPHKRIVDWRSLDQLKRRGFNADVVGDQASLTFNRTRLTSIMSLDLASNPASPAYTASRITEVDSAAPIGERVKCWQPTERQQVVVEFLIRFDQAATPPNLTENLFLWNAPLPASPAEVAIPVTSIGVSRSMGVYQAVVAQDLEITTFQGTLHLTPMPAWLDPTSWHAVRTTVSQTRAVIEVAQGDRGYTPVLQADLPHPPEPLAFEFSLDNEAFPGFYAPVVVADGLDVAYLDIRLARAR